MACCLMAPNHYLNQWWLTINIFQEEILMNFTHNMRSKITLKLLPHIPEANELIPAIPRGNPSLFPSMTAVWSPWSITGGSCVGNLEQTFRGKDSKITREIILNIDACSWWVKCKTICELYDFWWYFVHLISYIISNCLGAHSTWYTENEIKSKNRN